MQNSSNWNFYIETSWRTQYQVQNNTQIRINQKVIKNDNSSGVVSRAVGGGGGGWGPYVLR